MLGLLFGTATTVGYFKAGLKNGKSVKKISRLYWRNSRAMFKSKVSTGHALPLYFDTLPVVCLMWQTRTVKLSPSDILSGSEGLKLLAAATPPFDMYTEDPTVNDYHYSTRRRE